MSQLTSNILIIPLLFHGKSTKKKAFCDTFWRWILAGHGRGIKGQQEKNKITCLPSVPILGKDK
jgi:hypothetical protein